MAATTTRRQRSNARKLARKVERQRLSEQERFQEQVEQLAQKGVRVRVNQLPKHG